MAEHLYIRDTGVDQEGNSQKQATTSYINLNGTTMRFEFDVSKADNSSLRYITDQSGTIKTFENNEATSVIVPRITIQGLMEDISTSDITALIEMSRTLGVKAITGGIGVLAALPEYENNEIKVKISKISFSEVMDDSEDTAGYTLMLEQVR